MKTTKLGTSRCGFICLYFSNKVQILSVPAFFAVGGRSLRITPRSLNGRSGWGRWVGLALENAADLMAGFEGWVQESRSLLLFMMEFTATFGAGCSRGTIFLGFLPSEDI